MIRVRQVARRSWFLGYLKWAVVKMKISVTLPVDLLRKIDRTDSNRSSFLERAARYYMTYLEREQRERLDLAIFNGQAIRLNEEALDVCRYQGLD